jgi:archaellum component FlaC
MSTTPSEPTNLVLELLRSMRADMNARFDAVDARFNAVDARFNEVDARFNEVDTRFNEVHQEIAGIKRELRGLKLNTIAEVYKANLTVASFADHESRIQELERKSR